MKQRWRADEMEMEINFKAMRWGWGFLIVSLAGWCFIDAITTGDIPAAPFGLECISVLIFYLEKIRLTKRLTSPDKDSDEE